MDYEDYSREDLLEAIADLEEELGVAEKQIGSLEEDVEDLSDEINKQNTTIDSLEEEVEDLNEQLSYFKGETMYDTLKQEILLELSELSLEDLQEIRSKVCHSY